MKHYSIDEVSQYVLKQHAITSSKQGNAYVIARYIARHNEIMNVCTHRLIAPACHAARSPPDGMLGRPRDIF
jgi:uncharacterized protein (UPF0333 family)